MARVYATQADAWPSDPPANADAVLRASSRVVDYLLRGVVYATDTDGYPTDTDNVTALKDATVAIALEAQEQGLTDTGATQQWESVSIGSVSLQTLQGASSSDTPTVAGLPVPPMALLALAEVGPVQVWVR